MTFLLFSKVVFGSCKSISGKYSIFQKCYFPKRKMFSCVGLHFQKFFKKYFLVFGKEEGKDKPRKTWTKPRLTLDWVRQCGASRAPLRRPRHRSRSRAIDCDLTFAPIARDRDWRFARSCRRSRSRLRADRDLAKRRGASWDCDRWCGRRTGACKAPHRRTQSSVKR